jgi:predicted nucleic acid-binding protein
LIVVDTSAWVELIRATGSTVHQRLESAIVAREPLAVTELVVAELLAGARTPKHRSQVRNMALSLPVLRLRGLAAYEAAAALYRACRDRGETLRGITDCLVAVPAIEARAPVLHLDRDFEILARHTPLEVALLDG